jgi:glycosyltransferase involved in cell wall biosynthesis
MKILAVSHDLERTGAPTALLRLLVALRHEHEITVVSRIKATGPLAAEFEAHGIAVAAGAAPSQHDLILCNTIATWDIVLQSRQLKKPVLWWIHEGVSGIRLMQGGNYDPAAFAAASLVVFPTGWQARAVYARWLAKARWTVAAMGVPAPQRRPAEGPRAAADAFVLAQVGTVNRRKGVDLTLSAVRHLDDPSIQVRFIGDRDPGFDPGIMADEAARFVERGVLAHEAVLDEVTGCDALILPTRDDLIPLSVIEAMMLGLPVLTSDFGPIPETVRQGRTGLLSPVGDHRVLAGNIAMLRRDPELRRTLGEAGRELALRKHGFDAHLAAMREAIDRAARNG